jgi:thiamine-monophosphate kinase
MSPFTSDRARSVAALGEVRLIAAIRHWLGDTTPAAPCGIGDDCAVLPPAHRHQLVTTDPVIFGRHFDATVPPRAVGAKLLKRNLSDIAAMGGRPLAAVVSLALAPATSLAWLRGFYLGLATCARRHGVAIVGGDVTQAARGFVGAFLTLHGESAGRRVLTRTGARAGDWLYVTGTLGGSRLGRHFQFTPRLAEGAWLARRPEVRAMMDLSDGFAKDAAALTPRGCEPAVFADVWPIDRRAREAARRSAQPPLRHALCDGEDYELLFTVDREADLAAVERAWARAFPRVRLTRLGWFVRRGRRPETALPLGDFHGYEHLQ